MTRPRLLLVPQHRAELLQHFEEMSGSLPRYFELHDAKDGADLEAARAVAAKLDGVVHSSDTDCEYYPCVLEADDPTGDAFFAALDVARDARASVSGWDNPKLEVVPSTERSTLALLTRLNPGELEELDEYIEAGDQAALKAAIGVLESYGPVVGIQLCTDDGASKLCLTVARHAPGVHVGVLTVRIET